MGVELVYLIPLHHKRCTLNSEYSTRILKQRRNELDVVLTVALQGQVKLRRQVKKQSVKVSLWSIFLDQPAAFVCLCEFSEVKSLAGKEALIFESGDTLRTAKAESHFM
ncbi:hypothetical protein B296_00042002 [Ensete ventricosum]|uniref:Uncharacterized protein n=1 Tax=Ensete ventricosum TaxID=4639 RepID=A0A426X3E7_ENSVE|nr:hypothetical protein B296_00042002 [Ensete ventricosum]